MAPNGAWTHGMDCCRHPLPSQDLASQLKRIWELIELLPSRKGALTPDELFRLGQVFDGGQRGTGSLDSPGCKPLIYLAHVMV
jgi:hypothetical protein